MTEHLDFDSEHASSMNGSLLLTVKEAAWVLQVSRTTVYELIYAEVLLSVKIGTCRRIRRSDLEDYVQGLVANS
jgi:excisionase family DNA binding protein